LGNPGAISAEGAVDRAAHPLLAAGDQVAVHAERERGVMVAEILGQRADVDAVRKQRAGESVP